MWLQHALAMDFPRTDAQAKQMEGTLQDVYGQAKETAADAAKAVRDRASEAGEFLRTAIQERPFTAAATAFGIGFLIGRLSRRADTRLKSEGLIVVTAWLSSNRFKCAYSSAIRLCRYCRSRSVSSVASSLQYRLMFS
jgi:ElaB/YqjD/DUF883 family membrane-anchored ribosome-binding protein